MGSSVDSRVVRLLFALVIVLIAGVATAVPAVACTAGSADPYCSKNAAGSQQTTKSSGKIVAGSGSRTVKITTAGGGGTTTKTVSAVVPAAVLPPCYYTQTYSGADMAAAATDPQYVQLAHQTGEDYSTWFPADA